jgi:hypothetical protein
MAFIMRVCRKSKTLALYSLVMLLWVGGDCYAGGQFVKIKQAQLSLQDNKARLSIKLDFQLNPSAEEALYSGIPLYWDVSIVLKQQTRLYKASVLLFLQTRIIKAIHRMATC